MKVLLTGGSGFLGCELCNELLQVGHEVVVLDDHSRGRPARLERFGDKVSLIDGDVRDFDAVKAATEGCEVVRPHQRHVEIPGLENQILLRKT